MPHPVQDFHTLYYNSRVWLQTSWLGVPVQKCPLDLWAYQEILVEVNPALVVETGTAAGGSALFLATICDQLGAGRVVTIDIAENGDRPEHPRISYLTGSSTDPEIVAEVRAAARDADRVMVILDSEHEADHVLAELRAYAPLVTPGSYLIIEDTNINGNPVLPDFGPGPREALDRFLEETNGFVVDERREKFFMTFNPRGYLRRSSESAKLAQPASAKSFRV
jgi:cephalosporin hydroxylase